MLIYQEQKHITKALGIAGHMASNYYNLGMARVANTVTHFHKFLLYILSYHDCCRSHYSALAIASTVPAPAATAAAAAVAVCANNAFAACSLSSLVLSLSLSAPSLGHTTVFS